MENTDSVKQIVLNIKGENISLSPEEAKKLYNDLIGLFGSPYIYPSYPIVTPFYPVYVKPYYDWTYCSTSGGGASVK